MISVQGGVIYCYALYVLVWLSYCWINLFTVMSTVILHPHCSYCFEEINNSRTELPVYKNIDLLCSEVSKDKNCPKVTGLILILVCCVFVISRVVCCTRSSIESWVYVNALARRDFPTLIDSMATFLTDIARFHARDILVIFLEIN